MKKLLLMTLILFCLVLSFAACEGNDDTGVSATTTDSSDLGTPTSQSTPAVTTSGSSEDSSPDNSGTTAGVTTAATIGGRDPAESDLWD